MPKNGKSSGFDKIPYEVLKFPIIIDVLHALFSLCFDTVILPSAWKKLLFPKFQRTILKISVFH